MRSPRNVLKIVAVICGYWVISISMVFANKYLVGDAKTKVDLTLFVAWMQCIVAVLAVLLTRLAKYLLTFSITGGASFSLGLARLRTREVLMMTVTFICMLGFNNLCLKNVGVAFFQVARSTTLLFVVFFSVTLLKKPISSPIFTCCLCIAFGFMLGIDQEKLVGTFSIIGVMFGVLTSFFAALNGIFTKKAMNVIDHDPVELAFLCNVNASLLFIPVLILSGQLRAVLSSDVLLDSTLWLFLVCTGVLGFMMAWISALQIDLTSPVTHHISANSKAVLQTIIAVIYYHHYKPILWWGSVFLVVGGALGYALLKMNEGVKSPEQMPYVRISMGEKDMINGSIAANGHNLKDISCTSIKISNV